MYHLRRIKSLMLTLLVCTAAHAQIESGKVYNFVNIGNAGKSMTYISENKLSIATTDNTDYKQLWYVEGNADSGYTLRSMANGYYLRSQNSANNTSWTTVKDIDNNCRFSCIAAGNGYTLRATNTTNDQHSMHYGSGTNSIVCWYSTANASQWTLTEVSLTEEELTANWEYVTSLRSGDIYQTALDALFTDNSCSELKPAYASYTKNQMMSNSYYQQLPSTLQKMVLKMCTDGTWQENNYDNSKDSWSAAYAKKYRVQLYEPYNNISAASKALSLNEHTNMNNPTGIFSGKREAIYVMVQGEIEDGASLYLDSYTGHNKLGTDHKKGIQLTEGLNIIPSDVAGRNYFINYVVETFDTSDGKRGHEAKARSLKDYDPLKIHIEGGYINGYYNKVGDALYGSGDKNADWEYIEDRATQTDVTVLGKYMTLQFPLRDEDTEQYVDEKDGDKVKWHKGLGSYLNDLVNIEDVINSWDNVMMWERLLLGVLDENTVNAEAKQSPYSITDSKQVIEYTGNDTDFPAGYGDYYNIHGLAYGVGGSAYMYGSGDHSGYHYNTMGGIIQNMPTNAGSHWGPAHEIGHQHQNLLKIRKEMEVTNNLFSNVVLWYFGETTSRVNGTEGSLENILNNFNKEDGHYLTNNIWGMTQMYYKLFLYYHVLGHNPKFYPRLFEILRQDPSNGMAGTVDGEEAQLHIYKKMCQAAGEDLTEFFRAHGFLKPLDGFAIDDYGVSTFYMTQAQIDAAIAEVKSWNYKENVAVLFINDATGETIKSHKGDNLELYGETKVCAEVGGYASFEESITNAEDLEFTVSGKTVTVNKGGGVGYAIFNEKGEIIAFSDKKTFTVSDECATALMWGEATVKVVNADNSVVNVENVDEVASKYTLLGELITEADAELTYLDATNTKVGYYKEGVLTALQTARDEAKVVYDNQDTQSYTAAYAKLSEELYAVTHNDYNRVSVMAGGIYRLQSRNSSNWMSVNGENKVVGEASNESSTSQQWIFEAAGEDDTYYIKNASTSLYIGGAEKSEQVATQAEAKAYKVVSVETGVWTLQCQDSKLQWLNHNGGSVLGWNDGNDHNSQWYITFKSVTQDAQKLHELNTLVQQTKELIGEMAEVTPMQKQTLQTTSSSSAFYLSTNACHNTLNNASDGQGLAGLLDEDVSTFFHSDYGNKVTDTHYLQVDLGSVKDLSEYIFYYTTRDDGNNCPTTIEVWGSTDGTNFNTLLYTFTELPTGAGQAWESPMLTQATNYSSLRFMVTAAEGEKRFFVMSRFGIAKCEATVQSMDNAYTDKGLTESKLVAAYADIHAASDKIKVGNATSEELEPLYNNLSDEYDELLTIYNAAENAAFIAKQTELANLINSTNHLIGQCGSVTPVIGGALTLSTTAGNNVNYLTTGPNATPSAGKLSDLIDTDNTTSFTSNWERQSGNPYLQVQLPDGQELSKFTFTFTARSGGGAPTPSTIVVSGSNDGNNFTPIGTFTKENHGFPAAASGGTWNSPEIAAKEAYKYLRFTVTKSERSTSGAEAPSGYYHFGISHFGIATVSETVVTVLPGLGEVTEELLLETHDVVAAAQATYDMATTEELLQKAIDKLTEQQKKLQDAKDAVKYVDFFISSNVTGGGVVYGEQSCTDKLTAPSTLEDGDLKAMPVDDYVAKSITINGTTISIIYNKVYTVQVVGLANGGGVVYEETTTVNGKTFDAPLELTAENLSAVTVEGYVSEITIENNIVTVTYKKIYTVNVVGIEGLGGVKYGEGEYIQHGGEIHVLGTLEESQLTALVVEGYKEYVTSEDATITITYKKVYTVAITGGKGNGNVTYNEKTYADGDTIQVVGNIDENLIIAATLVGYNEATIEVDHDAATISATFTMLPLVDSEMYYTLACKATDHSAYIRDNGSVINGHSTEGSLFQFVKANDENGYYIKSYATDKYINHAEGKVFASTDKITIWTIAKHTSEAYTLTVGDDLYLDNVDTDCTDGSCTYLQSKVHPGGPNADNACSLWTLAVEEPVNDVTELETLISGTNSLIESCSSFTNSYYVNAGMISATTEAANSAQAICDNPSTTTLSKYTAVKESLQTAYNTLSAAKNSAETESQLRANLQTLVNNTSDLMALCGSVTYVEATEDDEVDLQVDQPTGAGYLSANSCQSEDFSVGKLLDNDINSHFHSSWSVAATDDHYLQVYLGEGQSLAEFTFTYTTRNLGNTNTSPAPTKIQVYGSVDGTSFNEDNLLATFTKDGNNLPAHTSAGAEWTSTKIKSETSYRYIRFYVRTSQGPGNAEKDGHYFFAMSSFSLTSIGQPEKWEVVLAAPGVRDVSEDMLRTVYLQNREASGLLSEHTDNATLQATIDVLTTAYGELETAYNTFILDKTELINLITTTEGLANGCYEGEEFKYTNSFNVTEDLVEATRTVLAIAIQVRDNQLASVEAYEAALADLKVAHKNLQTAIDYANLPVQLTFDVNSPVTYKMKIARANTPVLAYDEGSSMVAVTEFVFGNKSHGWYFMAATDGKVRIVPYHNLNTTLVLSTNSFAQDNSKVKAVSIGTEGYTQEWTISNTNMNDANRNAGWYNITTVNPSNTETTWYFSNHGGVGNKMGFYNDANDDGSRFQFEKADFSKSEAYYTLYNYYHGEMKVAGSNIQGVDAVGYYPTDKANAYNSAYSNATSILNNSTATDEEYTTAYNNLKAANEALELIMPKVGTYYTIVSACDDNNRNGQLMYATGENEMKFANDKAGTDGSWIRPEALWTFTEEGYMMNLQTGCHVGTSTWGGALTLVEDDAKVVSIEPLATLNGQVLLKPGNGYPLHAQASGSKIVGYSNENNASAWRIEEVDMAKVKHQLTIGDYLHAGLYLNYAVTIPTGMKAYYIDGSEIDINANGVGTLKLTQIDGNMLPAKTAVILDAPQGGNYDLQYVNSDDKIKGNLLEGSAYLQYRAAEANYKYFVFGVKNEKIGLYKNSVKYTASGATTKEGAEDATHYKMSANKVLFKWDSSATQVSSFRFRVDTTNINNVELGDSIIIYDLYGRRILEVVTSGLYIINGEKRYIQVK